EEVNDVNTTVLEDIQTDSGNQIESDDASNQDITDEDSYNDIATALANEKEHESDSLFDIDKILSHRVTGTN
ncbi:MAG: hypothetical protein ACREOZ_02500, partial [Gloeomargaritales cyanobacterium]